MKWLVILTVFFATSLYADENSNFSLESEQKENTTSEEVVSEVISEPPAITDTENPRNLRFGFDGSGLGALSSVDYENGYSSGLGWGIGLHLEWIWRPELRYFLKTGFQSVSLGRYIGSSGQIHDPASLYIQTQKGPYLQLGASFPFVESHSDSLEYYRLSWTLGAELFQGMEAYQTTSFDTQNNLKGSRFLFALAGATLSWRVRSGWELSLLGQFFINMVGSSQFDLMGGRLSLALDTPL